jgi:hypothetical protein
VEEGVEGVEEEEGKEEGGIIIIIVIILPEEEGVEGSIIGILIAIISE